MVLNCFPLRSLLISFGIELIYWVPVVVTVLLWVCWERGTPITITYYVKLGSVVSTGPCSKSSAAVITISGSYVVWTARSSLHAGRASS